MREGGTEGGREGGREGEGWRKGGREGGREREREREGGWIGEHNINGGCICINIILQLFISHRKSSHTNAIHNLLCPHQLCIQTPNTCHIT